MNSIDSPPLSPRSDHKVPPHLWVLTKHMKNMMMEHGAGSRPTSVRDGRHVTILALVSRGLLKFVDSRRATSPTAHGWTVTRKLLAAEADQLLEHLEP